MALILFPCRGCGGPLQSGAELERCYCDSCHEIRQEEKSWMQRQQRWDAHQAYVGD